MPQLIAKQGGGGGGGRREGRNKVDRKSWTPAKKIHKKESSVLIVKNAQ